MSNSASTATDTEAEQYLKELAPHLAALPADERADLLEDLAQHLREIAAEPGPPLAERLGPPEAYAAELLASAGVPPTGRPRPSLPDRARGSWAGQELARLQPVLRPAWWVIRGYLAVSLLTALEQEGAYPGFPVPRLFGMPLLGLLAVLVAVPVSVRLGQRPLPRAGRLAVIGANLVLAVYALTLLDRVGTPEVRWVESYTGPQMPYDRGCLATGSGAPITNLYAYDPEGRLLDPVLLYDQNGQPIDNLCPEVDDQGRRLTTEYRQDANGAPVINAFPRRQSATLHPVPGQPPATAPVRPPAVVVPRLAPPTTLPATPSG